MMYTTFRDRSLCNNINVSHLKMLQTALSHELLKCVLQHVLEKCKNILYSFYRSQPSKYCVAVKRGFINLHYPEVGNIIPLN